MEQNNYTCSIMANVPAEAAFEAIANVSGWWAKNFEGAALHNGDSFTVRFGDTWVVFDIVDADPAKKIVWVVRDCNLPWLSDKKEWNGTKVEWLLTQIGSSTTVDMTHVGLTPEIECYNACNKGWTGHIAGSLLKLITEGKGSPE